MVHCGTCSMRQRRFSSFPEGKSCLVGGRLGVMCFSGGIEMEGLEVDYSSGFAILLGTNYHTMATCYRFSDWDRFKDLQSHLPIQPRFDGILPVKGYWYG